MFLVIILFVLYSSFPDNCIQRMVGIYSQGSFCLKISMFYIITKHEINLTLNVKVETDQRQLFFGAFVEQLSN